MSLTNVMIVKYRCLKKITFIFSNETRSKIIKRKYTIKGSEWYILNTKCVIIFFISLSLCVIIFFISLSLTKDFEQSNTNNGINRDTILCEQYPN